MGIFPGLFLRKMDASVNYFIKQYQSKYEMYTAEKNGNSVPAALQNVVNSEAVSREGLISSRR